MIFNVSNGRLKHLVIIMSAIFFYRLPKKLRINVIMAEERRDLVLPVLRNIKSLP